MNDKVYPPCKAWSQLKKTLDSKESENFWSIILILMNNQIKDKVIATEQYYSSVLKYYSSSDKSDKAIYKLMNQVAKHFEVYDLFRATTFFFANKGVILSTKKAKKSKREGRKQLLAIKKIIEVAIDKFQEFVMLNPKLIINEDDYKWRMAALIDQCLTSSTINEYSVHTEINNVQPKDSVEIKNDRRPDLVILDVDAFEKSKDREGMEYKGFSFAIELKYVHAKDDVKNKLKKDYEKRKDLEDDSWLYIIPLIECADVDFKSAQKEMSILFDDVRNSIKNERELKKLKQNLFHKAIRIERLI